jgi:hypothetical protein
LYLGSYHLEGNINDEGAANLEAKGSVTHNNAPGVFAMNGNNYFQDCSRGIRRFPQAL